jgi:peptidoglycan/xylan/chitin deacetylase (PgdA/CDA1 family)
MFPQQRLCAAALAASVLACGVVSGSAVAQIAPPAPAANTSATSCPGNPDALGVSRILTVSPSDYARLGQMQYRRTLPLNDHEVVLTFDDGPLPPYTTRILSALSRECVKATFFVVGRMAAAYPDTLKLVAAQGHTIGNHSQNHPLHFDAISEATAEREVENGVRSIKAALGNDGTLAPFFRVPGLGRTRAVEQYLKSRSMVVWSSDTLADDWTRISSDQVLHRALSRLESRGRGILLLHDIQPRTALMLPELLRDLKKRGFKIVHVVPDRAAPQPAPIAPDFLMAAPLKPAWPRVLSGDTLNLIPAAVKAEPHGPLGDFGSVEPELPAAPNTVVKTAAAGKTPQNGLQTANLTVVDRDRPEAMP